MAELKAKIHRDRLKHNIGVVLAHVPERIRVIGVVKSGGYGHGAAEIAGVLTEVGIDYLAVSDLEEGLSLRKHLQQTPILVLGEIGARHAAEALINDLTVTLSDLDTASKLSRIAGAMETRARVHIKVDTGMGRFGMPPESVVSAIEALSEISTLHVEGLCSHLSTTFSDDEESDGFTLRQLDLFEAVCRETDDRGLLPEMVHIGSSTGLIGFPDRVVSGLCNSLRIGTLFLGYEERPSDWHRHVKPVADIYTVVHMIRTLPAGHPVGYAKTFTTTRETRVAILPVGYGHGFHRDLGNTGEVVVNGLRAPIIGKPSLGQIMVDVSHIADVKPGDRAVLAGTDISAFEEGRKISRGTWEVLLPLLEHCERTYL